MASHSPARSASPADTLRHRHEVSGGLSVAPGAKPVRRGGGSPRAYAVSAGLSLSIHALLLAALVIAGRHAMNRAPEPRIRVTLVPAVTLGTPGAGPEGGGGGGSGGPTAGEAAAPPAPARPTPAPPAPAERHVRKLARKPAEAPPAPRLPPSPAPTVTEAPRPAREDAPQEAREESRAETTSPAQDERASGQPPGAQASSGTPGEGSGTGVGSGTGSGIGSGSGSGSGGGNGSGIGKGEGSGSGGSRLKVLEGPPPPYPPIARRAGWEGAVVLRVLVSPDGNPTKVEVRSTSGHEVLDQAAAKAVGRWRFEPAKRGGHAIASLGDVTLRFRLDD